MFVEIAWNRPNRYIRVRFPLSWRREFPRKFDWYQYRDALSSNILSSLWSGSATDKVLVFKGFLKFLTYLLSHLKELLENECQPSCFARLNLLGGRFSDRER